MRVVEALLLGAAVAWAGAALSGCGSKDPGGTPPPGGTGGPTAAFTAPATANVQAPVVFDASGSTSSDGSALSYAWDFGSGRRGGGRTIAQVFTSGGARDVTLAVVDGKGRSAQARKSIAIQGPAPAARTLMAQGLVRTVAGDPLEGRPRTTSASSTSPPSSYC